MMLQTIANDHQIRSVISFSSHLDIELLRNSILKTFAAIPILNSRYTIAKRGSYWIPQTTNLDSFISLHTANDTCDLTPFLSNIPDEKGPQISFQVIRNEIYDLLIITIDHMVMDGAGFKFYLYYLASVYSGKDSIVSDCDRRIETVLKNISLLSKIRTILRRSETKSKNVFLDNVDSPELIYLNLLKITPDEYRKVKAYCKTHNVTINDFVVSVFAKSIFDVNNSCLVDITIQVMFDLRRYADKYPVSKYGNFSSMESVTIRNNEKFSYILSEVHKSMNKIKRGFPGIKNIMLMHFAFSLLPAKTFNSLLTSKIESFGISTSNLGVIDNQLLQFSGTVVTDAYILTSIKKQPAVQLSFSTFRETVTLSVLGRYSEKNTAVIKKVGEVMKKVISNC